MAADGLVTQSQGINRRATYPGLEYFGLGALNIGVWEIWKNF